uniref:Uncharacterized protein n=1 Tax=Myotis myotis TaxID=51298 RepID=A0A7J7V3K7_MYOMY|nr:hypothetical protein mMyoMyo1_008479 [Myotis myotis]
MPEDGGGHRAGVSRRLGLLPATEEGKLPTGPGLCSRRGWGPGLRLRRGWGWVTRGNPGFQPALASARGAGKKKKEGLGVAGAEKISLAAAVRPKAWVPGARGKPVLAAKGRKAYCANLRATGH